MRRASPSRAKNSGFTLLEILVGLFVSALIMAGLSMMTKTMNLAWLSTTDALGDEDSFATSFYVIAGDISRIERLTNRPDGARQFLFHGSQQQAIYVLAERPAFNQQGLYWVRLFVQTDDAGTALVRMRAPYESRFQDISSIAWGDAVVLLRGQFGIRFSYRTSRGNFTAWTSEWDLRDRLPEQVRVEIWDSRSGQMIRPAFVGRLRIDAESVCANQQARGCTIQTQGQLSPQ